MVQATAPLLDSTAGIWPVHRYPCKADLRTSVMWGRLWLILAAELEWNSEICEY